jgi:ribonuclease HI
LKIYVDGGTKGSRICLVDGDTEIIKYRKHTPTNNELEYLAVLYALGYVRHKYKGKNITIYSDSKLIVNQLTGKWRVTTESLKPLYDKCTAMMTKKIKLIWTRREFNRAGWVLDRPF